MFVAMSCAKCASLWPPNTNPRQSPGWRYHGHNMKLLRKLFNLIAPAQHAWAYHENGAHRHCARCHLDQSRDVTTGAYGPAWLE